MWFQWPFYLSESWFRMLRAAARTHPITVRKQGANDSATELVVVAEAPTFKANELSADIQGDTLEIRAERHDRGRADELHLVYQCKVPLPPTVKAEEARTSVNDGHVEVRIPKLPGIDGWEP